MRMYASADDHCGHGKQHGPERRREDLGFEDLCSLNDAAALRETRDEIFYLFACADEIKHRHALREGYQKRREQSKKDVLRETSSGHR